MEDKALNQCNLCDQFLYPSCSRTASSAPVCVGLYMLVASVVVLTVCGNLLVIISICSFKHLHTPTNLILLSLAVADLLVGLIVIPFYFSILLESCWRLGMFTCKLFHVCSNFLSSVSVYNVVFIAVDRYFALHDPLLYTSKMTVNISLMILCIIWVYSLIYTMVMFYLSGNLSTKDSYGCPGECVLKLVEIWAFVDLICVFFVSWCVIIMLYGKIFAIAKRHINAISSHNTKNHKSVNHTMVSEVKAAVNLGIVVVVFLLCSIPYTIIMFISFKSKDAFLFDVIANAVIPVFLNSTINPIIYALFYSWFQKCVKHILTYVFCSSSSTLIEHVLY